MSIYQPHTHTNMHTKHLSAELAVSATQALKPPLRQAWVKGAQWLQKKVHRQEMTEEKQRAADG